MTTPMENGCTRIPLLALPRALGTSPPKMASQERIRTTQNMGPVLASKTTRLGDKVPALFPRWTVLTRAVITLLNRCPGMPAEIIATHECFRATAKFCLTEVKGRCQRMKTLLDNRL